MATSMAAGDVDASPRGSMTQGDAESLSGRGGEDTSRGGGWTAEEWQAWYEARWWDGSATTGSQAGRQPEIFWSDRHHSGAYEQALRLVRTHGVPGETLGPTIELMDLEKNEVAALTRSWFRSSALKMIEKEVKPEDT